MSETQALATQQPKLHLVPKDLTPAAIAPADEANDLDFVRPQAKFLQFNGQDGIYKDRSSEEKDPDKHPKAITGLILAASGSQVWFPRRPDDKDQAAYQADKQTWGEAKWLCRNPNKRNAPMLNPDLTEAQKAEALARGAGKNCLLCPLAKGRKVNGAFVPPVCKAGVNLLMLEESQEVAVVHFGGESGRNLEDWLGRHFKRGSTLRTYAYAVQCGREVATNGQGVNFKVATFQLGPATDPEMYDDLAGLRAAYLHQLDGLVEQHVESEPDTGGSSSSSPPPAPPPPPPPPPGRAPTQPPAPPPAPVQQTFTPSPPAPAAPSNGLQLDPDTGEPILPGEAPPAPAAYASPPAAPAAPTPDFGLSGAPGLTDCPF